MVAHPSVTPTDYVISEETARALAQGLLHTYRLYAITHGAAADADAITWFMAQLAPAAVSA